MRITVTDHYYQTGAPIGVCHHGLHLKRKLGGPPWWKYMNGFYFWLPNRRMVWVEFYKSGFQRKRIFEDRSRARVVKS
jgi:hypothetical protein